MSNRIIVLIDPDLEDLIPGFLGNRRKDIEIMRAALERGAFDEIRTIGHSMKGAGGGYGFDAITDIGARIEQGALARSTEVIADGILELSDYLDRVDVVYS
jgi:HPt (histidine-containing phosphotransfer) domain-containing protein